MIDKDKLLFEQMEKIRLTNIISSMSPKMEEQVIININKAQKNYIKSLYFKND